MAEIAGPTFLPGLKIEAGALLVDLEKLKVPAACCTRQVVWPYCLWSALNGDAGNDGGIEMTAIAWSYAAAVHLGIEIEVLFHPDGYKPSGWRATLKPATIAFSGLL